MRTHAVLAASLLAIFCAGAQAEVLRCEDAAGKVSYTDSTCPAGTKPQRRVSVKEPVSVLPDPQGDARAVREGSSGSGARRPAANVPPTSPTAPVSPAAPAAPGASSGPAGAVIIDGRGATPEQRSDAERWDTELGGDPQVAEGYYPAPAPYPYPYAGAQRPPPPRDQRPRITRCDPATGCTDRLGNNYNQNTGKLQRYPSIDGKTCSPVGTTVVCR